jgi:hypothetical protein
MTTMTTGRCAVACTRVCVGGLGVGGYVPGWISGGMNWGAAVTCVLPDAACVFLGVAARQHAPCAQAAARRFIPFSTGPRSCIGQNLAVMNYTATLAVLLSRFTFQVADDKVRGLSTPTPSWLPARKQPGIWWDTLLLCHNTLTAKSGINALSCAWLMSCR